MSTLAASFLEDFDELSEEEEEEEQQEQLEQTDGKIIKDEQLPQEPTKVSSKDDLDTVDKFHDSKDFKDQLKAVTDFRKEKVTSFTGPTEMSRAYQLVVVANKLCVEIDNEINRIHTLVAERYSKRFPELTSHVIEPILYVKVVKLVGNESDMTKLELSSILPSSQVMAVSMTGSRLSTDLLDQAELDKVTHACDVVLSLDDIKRSTLLQFVEGQMPILAPNLSELLGGEITAQLLSLVGGLRALTNIPSCNVQVIGKGQQALHGFSRVATMRHHGVVAGCPLVQECLPEHRAKAMRVVCGRTTLAARLDNSKSDPTGSAGKKWHEEIRGKLKKWHAPPPGKTKRPLPVPIDRRKKKRGGRRARRMKELYGISDVQKEVNRVKFGVGDDEYGDSAMGKTFGMLGKEGSGKLRITAKEQRKQKVELNKYKNSSNNGSSRFGLLSALGNSAIPGTATHAVSGTASSIAITPVQGIELVNPAAAQKKIDEANMKYFGSMSFKKK